MSAGTLTPNEKAALTAYAKQLAARGEEASNAKKESDANGIRNNSPHTNLMEQMEILSRNLTDLKRKSETSLFELENRCMRLEKQLSVFRGEVVGAKDLLVLLEKKSDENKLELAQATKNLVEEFAARFNETVDRLDKLINSNDDF